MDHSGARRFQYGAIAALLWGGLRGEISVALAWSLPPTVPRAGADDQPGAGRANDTAIGVAAGMTEKRETDHP